MEVMFTWVDCRDEQFQPAVACWEQRQDDRTDKNLDPSALSISKIQKSEFYTQISSIRISINTIISKSFPRGMPRTQNLFTLLSSILLLSILFIAAMADSQSTSDAKVYIVYTERPEEGVEHEDFHLKTLASVVGRYPFTFLVCSLSYFVYIEEAFWFMV